MNDIGILTLFIGGTGKAAYDAAPSFDDSLVEAITIDCDMATDPDLLLSLAKHCRPLRECPEVYGDDSVLHFAQRYEAMLQPVKLDAGARTLRPLGQAAVAVNRDDVIASLREGVRRLYKRKAKSVIVLLVTSTAGGTGSSVSVAIAELLNDPKVKGEVELGATSGILQPTIIAAFDPWERVLQVSSSGDVAAKQALLMRANMYEFGLDLRRLSESGAVQFFLLYGQDQNVASADWLEQRQDRELGPDADRAAARFGQAVASFVSSFPMHLRPRWVDTAFGEFITRQRELPEGVL